MNPLKLLLIIRIFGAGITAGLFGHQLEDIAKDYGFDFLSIGYLFAVLTFYTSLYLIRFFAACKFEGDKDEKYIIKIQIALSLISAALAIIEVWKSHQSFDLDAWIHIFLAVLFVFLPDLIYKFLIKVYNLLTKDGPIQS